MKKTKLFVVNKDDRALYSLAESSEVPHFSFGIENDADFKAVKLENDGGFYSFSIENNGGILANINLSVLGRFSVYNALAAFSLAFSLGISPEIVSKSVSEFSGIERRLEIIDWRKNGAPVIYDYAHHPSEIKSGISAVRDLYKGSVNVIFKPHTYTRTRDLFDEFVIALSLADRVFLSEIDAIREDKVEGISSEKLARAIGENAKSLPDSRIIEEISKCDGTVVIMGAADLSFIKEKIVADNLRY